MKGQKMSVSEKIRQKLKEGVEVAKIAKQLGVTPQYVYQIRWQSKQKKVAKNDHPARVGRKGGSQRVHPATNGTATNGHDLGASDHGVAGITSLVAPAGELAETLKSIRDRATSYRNFTESYVKELYEVKSFVDAELHTLQEKAAA